MKDYLLIKGSEDGTKVIPMSKEDINLWLKEQEEVIPEYKAEFMSDWPIEMDTNYWGNKVIIVGVSGVIVPTVRLSII